MRRVAFSPAARTDIEDIWNYTVETWGIDQAETYTDAIQDACEGLAVGQKQGRLVTVREGYLKYPVGRHMIFYRMDDKNMIVTRILHQSMDVERHF